MAELFFDHRWCAPHGIGRFATEVRRRLEGFADLPLDGSPTSPLDPFRLGDCLRKAGSKLFFSPGFNVPVFGCGTVVTTIHDLIHLHASGQASIAKRAYYRYFQRSVVRRSPVTLTVSEFSRQQIVRWYGLPEDRVHVVGNGVSDEFVSDGDMIESDRPYFLYVGNTKFHKNIPALLAAMEILPEDCKLTMIVKSDSWLDEQLQERCLTDRTTVVSGLSDNDLAKYYRGAIATILPSYYEGFGLPIAEAMATGCPVVASDRTAIPEVAGGAALLFDPDNSDQLADRMRQVLDRTIDIDELVKRGLARASQFSWDQVGSRVSEAIKLSRCA